LLRSLLAPPGLGDVLSLVRYVLDDPRLFIGSTTVMTSGLVLTPPWFAFQNQLDLVMGVARTALVAALAVNLVLRWRLSPAPAAAAPAEASSGEAAPAEA